MSEAMSGVEPAAFSAATILVVDDEPRNVRLLQGLLESRGYTVWTAGLGLTFCKLAVEAHGGKIGVDSSAGGGARFWIELPRKTESS